jgi:hypothetical protein
VYIDDKKNLVALVRELYPQLRQRDKIFVLAIGQNIAALYYGLYHIFTLHVCKLKKKTSPGTDFAKLFNHVDFFYAPVFGYNGVWSDTVQFDTTFSYLVRAFNYVLAADFASRHKKLNKINVLARFHRLLSKANGLKNEKDSIGF